MQKNTPNQERHPGFARWIPRLLAVACLSAVGAWLYLAALGCSGNIMQANTFTLTLVPQSVTVVPSGSYTANASFEWDGAPYSADWSLGHVPVVSSSSCAPQTGTATTVQFSTEDQEGFKRSIPEFTSSYLRTFDLNVGAYFTHPITDKRSLAERDLALQYWVPNVSIALFSGRVIGEDTAALRGQALLIDTPDYANYVFDPSVSVSHLTADEVPMWQECGALPVTLNGNKANFDGVVTCARRRIMISYGVRSGNKWFNANRFFRLE
jgi:hypothetical protein